MFREGDRVARTAAVLNYPTTDPSLGACLRIYAYFLHTYFA